MTKAELVARIAEKAGINKKIAQAALESLVGAVHDTLKKEKRIRIADLGTFSVVRRKARTGVNPQTGTKIKISAMVVPTFKASKALKASVDAAGGIQTPPPPPGPNTK